jgi:tRNA(Ile)-lysidine synthase
MQPVDIKPGRYVVAVSGGVDSMVLLHLLHQMSLAPHQSWWLTVAHFDHGIRDDSAEDRRLVQAAARQYGLPFVYDQGRLGPGTSEATARQARYAFLYQVLGAGGAQAIVTAHHQDDVLETAILNLLRGAGRKGLTSLSSRPHMLRPLLSVPKAALLDYARTHDLSWREDSTNRNQRYARNYVRHRLLPRFTPSNRQALWSIIVKQQAVNRQLDQVLANQLHLQSVAGTIDRRWFNQLPHAVAKEVIATWLRANEERQFDSRLLERLVVQAKVAAPGREFSLSKRHSLRISRTYLALPKLER